MHIAKTSMGAVLTGDIVNSTDLTPSQEKALLDELLELFLKNYEFSRGDSFQVYMDNIGDALRMALVCRALAIGLTAKNEAENEGKFDIRISIGIGKVNLPIEKLGLAKGDAFLLSGRRLDKIKESKQRLIISCDNEIADIGLEVMADYLDNIFARMTAKQAELITALLQGITQQQMSVSLNKSKSTISQLANAGRWPEIERLLEQYKLMIEKLYKKS